MPGGRGFPSMAIGPIMKFVRPGIPSWLISMLLHMALLIVLALALRMP